MCSLKQSMMRHTQFSCKWLSWKNQNIVYTQAHIQHETFILDCYFSKLSFEHELVLRNVTYFNKHPLPGKC